MLKLLCKLMCKVARKKGYSYISLVYLDNDDGPSYVSLRAKDGEHIMEDAHSFSNGRRWVENIKKGEADEY